MKKYDFLHNFLNIRRSKFILKPVSPLNDWPNKFPLGTLTKYVAISGKKYLPKGPNIMCVRRF